MNIFNRAKNNVNKVTVGVYNKYFRDYIDNTPQTYSGMHESMLAWINAVTSFLPKGASIFEVGSATPRDATYLRSHGFTVQCSDACPNFLNYLRDNGENAIEFDALIDELPNGYDMYFANAVFPHFTAKDLESFLTRAYTATNPGSMLMFDLKQGKGQAWLIAKMPVGRYTKYWQPDKLRRLIESIGYEIIYFESDVLSGVQGEKWINVGIRRPTL